MFKDIKKVVIIVLLGLVVSACDSSKETQKQLPAKAHRAVIKTITGERINFSHLSRPWVIVNYWASWCEPCKKEIPELNAFFESHDNVYLVGVNYDGVDNHQLLELIAKNDIHYFNALTDPSNELGIGDIPGLPVTFVFNNKGQLHKTLFGPQTQETLKRAIS